MATTPDQEDLMELPADELAMFASREEQKQAARLAQDAFAECFRLSLSQDDAGRAAGVEHVRGHLAKWVEDGSSQDVHALRRAMLMSGLDQWGVAYSKAFSLQAIPALTELLGALRTELDPQEDALFQQHFEAIEASEGNAVDFKVELRRSLHLALWHAMIACDEREEAHAILRQLGGMMFSATKQMPRLGWRLIADAFAQIQVQCLAQGLATEGLAQETTVSLFAALSQELPKQQWELAMAHAGQALQSWREAQQAKGVPATHGPSGETLH